MAGKSSNLTVSVIIPTYNAGLYVVEAVESVLAQTWQDIEIIVVDDGSTDDTRHALAPYLDRLTYVYQENCGRSAARNQGIARANGLYVAFLDADDTWYPDKIERQVNGLRQYNARWAYCCCHLIDQSGRPLNSTFWPDSFGCGVSGVSQISDRVFSQSLEISTSTVLVERELLNEMGGFDESFPSSEDTDLWARLSVASDILFSPDVLGTRRVNTKEIARDRFVRHNMDTHYLRALRIYLDRVGRTSAEPIIRKVLYGCLLNSAFIRFSAGDIESGEKYWHEAMSATELPMGKRNIAYRLASFAISAARYHTDGPAMAEHILLDLVQVIPVPGHRRRTIKRQALVELFAAVSFVYETRRIAPQVRRYARKALCHGGSGWWNIGLWKRALYKVA